MPNDVIDMWNQAIEFLHYVVNYGVETAQAFNVLVLIQAGVFYAIIGVSLLMALGVIFFRNIVHSALSLAGCFIGIGCLYIYLSAEFLGAVQIMVYGGAVAILIVMGLMFVTRDEGQVSNPARGILPHIAALIVSGAFFLIMSASAIMSPFPNVTVELGDSVTGLADLMLMKYILPFEVVAVLLLIAMIGAIILARGVQKS